MNKPHLESNSIHSKLTALIHKYSLTIAQTDQFIRYLQLLVEWNEKFNLTAITNITDIIEHHFDDSLALSQHIDFSRIHSTADIGTGAGFPGIPLKILFPHLSTTLIEVNNKKRTFLAHVIQELSLENMTIYEYDWRTFLRSADYSIDYFFARASLQPEELVRIFKASSAYKEAILVYWASKQWEPKKIEVPFIFKEIAYTLDTVQRKFVFFKNKE